MGVHQNGQVDGAGCILSNELHPPPLGDSG